MSSPRLLGLDRNHRMYNLTHSYEDEEIVVNLSGSQCQFVAEPGKRAQSFCYSNHHNNNTNNFNLHLLCTYHARRRAKQVYLFSYNPHNQSVCSILLFQFYSWRNWNPENPPPSHSAIFGTGSGWHLGQAPEPVTLKTKSGTHMLIPHI